MTAAKEILANTSKRTRTKLTPTTTKSTTITSAKQFENN